MKARLLFCAVLFVAAAAAWANPQLPVEPDYFARFKYDLSGALALLQSASGKPLSATPAAYQLLDDMGYWNLVRSSQSATSFTLTPGLEAQVRAQYAYLEKAYRYEAGDVVWTRNEGPQEATHGVAAINHRGVIREKISSSGTDFYIVDVYVDGPAKMTHRTGKFYDGRQGQILYYGDQYRHEKKTTVYTKAELDELNSPGSSLEKDNRGEVLDWKNDAIWKEKLEAFKAKMASASFEIDWTASSDQIEARQKKLMLEIFRHFKMDRNAPSRNGQGIGARACGGGVCFDQALVLTYAVQAVGQTSGIKATNLDGKTVNPQGGHGFVKIELKGNPQEAVFDRAPTYDDWEKYKKDVSKIPESQLIFPGTKVKTSSFVAISDPGWADFGVTPDDYALVEVGGALNPAPVDANRAVDGISSQRALVEVAKAVQAKGPFGVYAPQALQKIDPKLREKLAQELAKDGDVKPLLPAGCGSAFGN